MELLELMNNVHEFHNDLYNTWLSIWKGKSEYTIKLGNDDEVYGYTLEEVYQEAYNYLLEEYREMEQENLEFKKGGEEYYNQYDN